MSDTPNPTPNEPDPVVKPARKGLGWKAAVNPISLGLIGVLALSGMFGLWMWTGSMPLWAVAAIFVGATALVLVIGAFAFSAETPAFGFGMAHCQTLVTALSEPAAVAALDGRILAANPAWIEAGGNARRLPQGPEAPALYVAMKEARAKHVGRALVKLSNFDFEMVVTRLGEAMVLVRAASQGVLGQGLLLEHEGRIENNLKGEDFLGEAAQAVAQPVLAAEDTEAPKRLTPGVDFAASAPVAQALLVGDTLKEAVIRQVNPAFSTLVKIASGDLLGLSLDSLFEDGAIEAETGLPRGLETRIKGQADCVVQIYATRLLAADKRTGFMLYILDISEHRRLEHSLAQGQKMQAIGQFAGGVAHDLNNLLTGLKLRVEELLHNHPLGDPSFTGLNEIRQISTRAEDLVRKLLAFSRKQTVKRVRLNLGELISEFEVLLRRLMREDVRLETQYGRDLPHIFADKGQMEMAIMNLVVNARDALHAHGGGKVIIRTASLTQTEAVAQGFRSCPAEGAALIEVSDTGPGMSPEIMQKVFEPFFTTKPLGEGTGLGLATVYGIVSQAEGHIELKSIEAPHEGHGATFSLFLPVRHETEAEVEKREAAAAAIPQKVIPKDISGTGRILFVEDEEIVRGIAARLLRQRGYEVTEACDGEEALEIIEAAAGQFDLLISDVIMPGLDGPSMLKRARPHLGNVPVMFISGYAEAEFSDLLSEEAGISFLPKPLDIKTLAERVKEKLAA